MFGKEEHALESPSPAYLGAACYGDDWNPGPIDERPVATRPTEEDRAAVLNSIIPEKVRPRKDCWGVILSMPLKSKILWVALVGTFVGIIVYCILIYPRQMAAKKELQAKSRKLQHEALCLNATLSNITLPNCTALVVLETASNLARFWEESSTVVPTTTLFPTSMVSVSLSATAVMEVHDGFITRVRSEKDERSITFATD